MTRDGLIAESSALGQEGHLTKSVVGLAIFAIVAIACASQPPVEPTSTSEPVPPRTESLVMLREPLDKPEFYCVDVAGFGSSLNLSAPLQAHTCKPNADDELFMFDESGEGQFFMDAYEVCAESGDGVLYVRKCVDSPGQWFVFEDDGRIGSQESDQCLTVQGGSGQPAGGRSHLRRDLLLLPCDEVEPQLSRWTLPGPRP